MPELPHEQQTSLQVWIERAWRFCCQRPKDKSKLYALHAPEAECIGKGKARQPYEFGVKVSLGITERHGLIVGARAFPGNPYDGHVLAEQLEQTSILLQEVQGEARVKTVLTDLGYRSVDADIAPVQLVHRGKSKTLSNKQRRWLKRRRAIEPIIGHVKHDHGMRRCWLKGKTGDAVHAVLCAAHYNLRWLLRAIARLGLKGFFAFAALLPADILANNLSHAPRIRFTPGFKQPFAAHIEFCRADQVGKCCLQIRSSEARARAVAPRLDLARRRASPRIERPTSRERRPAARLAQVQTDRQQRRGGSRDRRDQEHGGIAELTGDIAR